MVCMKSVAVVSEIGTIEQTNKKRFLKLNVIHQTILNAKLSNGNGWTLCVCVCMCKFYFNVICNSMYHNEPDMSGYTAMEEYSSRNLFQYLI